MIGLIKITDGVNETFTKRTDPMPNGWYRGRSDAFKRRMQQKRGKRSEAQRRNISIGHLGQISAVKGKIMITNGIHNAFIDESEKIPAGWHKGGKHFKRKTPVKPTTLNRQWITDGTNSRFLKPGETIPPGWKLGRTIAGK